jgi:hypothetical protein
MRFKNFFLLLCLLGAACLHQGAMAVEEPAFEVIESDGAFEIRRYKPMLIAETFVDGDMDEASSKGFRRIADYIFGNNQASGADKKTTIAMTAPVTMEPQSSTIAMTAPVTVAPQPGDDANSKQPSKRWRIHFVMPSAYTMATIPKPNNDAVKLRELPAKYFVVHRYSWLNTQARVEEKTQEALQWAKQRSLQVIGAPQLSRYDPPWTLPMFKRNEIMLEIVKP